MSVRYLIPCSCGNKLPVDVGRAGDVVPCTCGAQIDVPHLRELRQMERVENGDERTVSWGPRQGLVMLGTIVTFSAVTTALGIWCSMPSVPKINTQSALRRLDAQMEQMTLLESWQLWHDRLRNEGLVEYRTPARVHYHHRVQVLRVWINVSLAIAGCGLLIVLGGLVCVPRERRANRQR